LFWRGYQSARLYCVLTEDLEKHLGQKHKFEEGWTDERFVVTGKLHYGSDGFLRRIDAEDAEAVPWTEVSINDLKDVDILQGRSVSEHLALVRGDDIG
jgi:hypothetical protein